MHQRASPLMPVAVQCPLLGPLSRLQSCDMKRLRKTCHATPLAALFWEGQESRTPICARVYQEAVGAGTVFVLGETAWQEVCQFSRKLQKIVAAQLELGGVRAGWELPWHETGWTREKLTRMGVVLLNRHTPAVVCVEMGGGGTYVLKHVHVPDCVLPEVERKAVAFGMVALGERRFHGQPGGMPAARGESIIPRRGAKHSSGNLRMYGTRSLNGKHVHRYNPAVEEEEECTRLAGAHALALSALERVVTPDAAQARGTAAWNIPSSMRADVGGMCDAVSCSLTQGYVIGAHDDEAAVNETVVFTPMGSLPAGVDWCFFSAGIMHALPRSAGEVSYITMQGRDVWHGTLPSSSVAPHQVHCGLGSALCSQGRIVKHWDRL